MESSRGLPKLRQTAGAPLTDAELFALEDHELVAYIVRAKGAGNLERAVAATHVLLHKHEDRMRQRVALRLPEHLWHHTDTVADWVLQRVARSALKLPFEGGSIGEWVNWWTSAINRQVISFWRSRQGQALEAEVALPEEHEGEEDTGGRRGPNTPGKDFDVDAHVTALVRDQAIERVLSGMKNERHVEIIEVAILEDRPSKEVAKRFDTSAANVDKVKSRVQGEPEAGTRGARDRVAMSRVDELLQSYIEEHRQGGEADPRAFLREVSGSERNQLAALIDHYLARVPAKPFDPEAFKRFRADPCSHAAVDRILAPTLAELREQAELSKREVADALAEDLDLVGYEQAVKARYHELETGQLEPQKIATRVWSALAAVFGQSAERLREAVEPSRDVGRRDQAIAFARDGLHQAAASPATGAPAEQTSPGEHPVDARFFGD